MISTLGEFVPGLLSPMFARELATPGPLIGVLVATIFLASGIFSFPAGWLTDRVAPEILLVAQVGLAALAFMGFAFATGPTHLFIVCGLIGVAMAINQPSTNRIILKYLRPQHHAAAVGWRSVGVQASMVLGSLVFGATTGWLPWRVVIIVIVACMLVCGAWMFWVLRARAPFEIPMPAAPRSGDSGVGARPPRTTRAITWWMIPYTLFTSGAISSVAAYFVVFGTSALGLSLGSASLASGLFAASSLVARIFWVRCLSEKNQVALLFLASTSTAFAFVFLAMTPALGAWSFWLASFLIGITSTGSGPLSQIVTLQNANPARIGAVSGWVAIGTFAGLTFQPVLFSVFIGAFGIVSSWIAVALISLLGSATIALFWHLNRPNDGGPSRNA